MKIIITESRLNNLALKMLNKEYGNLTRVVDEDKISYVNKKGLPLFYYYLSYLNENYKSIFFDYNKIWLLLESIFAMGPDQIRNILNIWLEETYNLKGYTPSPILSQALENEK